ncbi:MAG TPA: Asp-tRNA(Asn)/Glu-tRNA(Gln) amidotransferase subunit GatC [Bacilli bacterium]
MSISMEDVDHVAKLARLEFTDVEKTKIAEQLGKILAFVEKLNELHTADVPPTSHVIALNNVLRDDEVRPSWPIEKVMLNAPDGEDGQFRVPAVLD